MLKTHGVLHFSLPVTDLDRSRKFYEGVLGMKVVEQSPRMVFLRTGDDYLILAKGRSRSSTTRRNTPVHHAFKVKPDEFQSSITTYCKKRRRSVQHRGAQHRRVLGTAGVFLRSGWQQAGDLCRAWGERQLIGV